MLYIFPGRKYVVDPAKDLPGHITERTELKGHPKVA